MPNSRSEVKPTSTNAVALSESAPLRYITFAALYVAQGVPEGLTFFAIPAWLAMNGVGAGPIGGYLAIIVLGIWFNFP